MKLRDALVRNIVSLLDRFDVTVEKPPLTGGPDDLGLPKEADRMMTTIAEAMEHEFGTANQAARWLRRQIGG